MLSVVMLNVVAPSRGREFESKVSNKTKCGFLSKRSHLDVILGVTKFIIPNAIILVTLIT
jgi:hypothetical protein